MFIKVADKIWKYTGSDKSNVFYLEETKTLIDCGNRADRQFLERDIKYMIEPSQIQTVIFTHLHSDHIGNFDLFSNAEFYASATEIEDLHKNPLNTILNKETAERFTAHVKPLPETINGLEVINVPGHTRGSIALWHAATRTLFTGDLLFHKGIYGRSDLPTSAPGSLKESLKKLEKYKFKVLCPGHDY
jgi:hydroxyacylglutathione hydrolase